MNRRLASRRETGHVLPWSEGGGRASGGGGAGRSRLGAYSRRKAVTATRFMAHPAGHAIRETLAAGAGRRAADDDDGGNA
jgi:hypothetical protein